jgi:hypothetical protein
MECEICAMASLFKIAIYDVNSAKFLLKPSQIDFIVIIARDILTIFGNL